MKRYVAMSVVALLGVTGCLRTSGPPAVGSGPLKVVATTGMIADAVRQVGGEHVQVTALMGPGTDPHTYIPSPGDADALASANIVFFNGLHLEGKMTQLLEENRGGTRAVAVASGIPHDRLRAAEGGDSGMAHDPHVWFDVRLWMKCVETVRNTLCHLDPDRAADYEANAKRYLAQLDALDLEVKAKAAKLPEGRRVLVTSHDAFGYFARAYGFEVKGLQGVSTATQVSTKEVEAVANYIGQREIPAIFGETSVAPKGLKKVLDTVKARYGRDVRLIGGDDALYSDALGEPGTPGETYVGMVRHNIDVIVKALGQ